MSLSKNSNHAEVICHLKIHDYHDYWQSISQQLTNILSIIGKGIGQPHWQRHWPTSLAKAVVNYCKSIWHHHWQRYRLSLAKELTIILKYIYHQWQRHCQSFSMARLKTLAKTLPIIIGKDLDTKMIFFNFRRA